MLKFSDGYLLGENFIFIIFKNFEYVFPSLYCLVYIYLDTDTVISTLDRLLYMNGLHGGSEGACFVWRECDTKHISLQKNFPVKQMR